VSWLLAAFGRDLFDAVSGLVESQKPDIAVCLFERMHIAALQVLHDGDFKTLRVGQFADVHRDRIDSGQLRGTEAPPSSDERTSRESTGP
jgi:hypothetical protein